ELGVRLLPHRLKGHRLLVGDDHGEDVLAAREIQALAGAGSNTLAAEDASQVLCQLRDALVSALLVAVEDVVDAFEGLLADAADLLKRGEPAGLVFHQQGGVLAVDDAVAGLVRRAAELRRCVEFADEDLALAAELAEQAVDVLLEHITEELRELALRIG